jgi:outer membrane protein TolC
LVAAGNPALQTALLEQRRAAALVEAQQGLYPFLLELDGGLTHQSTPMVTPDGTVSHRGSDQIVLGAALSKHLPVGTSLELSLDGARQVSKGTSLAMDQSSTNLPTYGMTAKLSATQPFLRGAGKRVGEAALRQAMAAQELARCSRSSAASELAERALIAYWELWYAQRAWEIDLRARDIAKAQLEEQQSKIEQGASAPADALPLRTQLSTLEETVIAAGAERDRLAVQLEALTGLIREEAHLAPDLAENPPMRARAEGNAALEQALQSSPAVRQVAAALYAAQDKARTAGESLRQKLDLIGWLQAQTMGIDRVSPLVTQLGDGPAYSAYLGLSYELPLSNQRKDSEAAAAQLEVEIARAKLVAATDQTRADVATALRGVENARLRVDLAEQTLSVAEQQAEATRQRAAVGAAIYVEVRDAEEAVRNAALRVARARVDLVEAGLSLDHVTGVLLARVEQAPH